MTPTPHDALFKAAFSQVEHASGILRALLPPALVARVDFDSLELSPGSFVDEALDGSHSDLLFSVNLSGRRAFLYVLFEHQSTPDPLMPYRLLHYEVRIWEQFLRAHPNTRKLPAIVPVVLHHGVPGWTAATAFDEVLDLDAELLAVLAEHLPRFRFILDDLAEGEEEALRDRAMSAFGRLVLLCLKLARNPEMLVERLGRWADLIREVYRAPNGVEALTLLLRYILAVGGERSMRELRALMTRAVREDTEEAVVTIVEHLQQWYFRDGRLDGKRETLLRQLRIRFGELPEGIVARVDAADHEQLDPWSDRVLTAATLDDVFADA